MDNSTNIVKAVSLKHWTRLQCFGHRLHLAIKGSMRDQRIQRAMGVCKKSGQRFFLLMEKETRTSGHSRGAQAAKAQVDHRITHQVPNPHAVFTGALSGEEYVSVSYLKPVLHLFNEEVLKPVADDSELTKTIKASVINYLNEKYDNAATDDLLNIASLVDPRFKTHYIKDDKVEAVKSRAVAQMLDQCQRTLQATPAFPSTELGGGKGDDGAAASPAKLQKKTLGSFFKKSYTDSVATSDLTEQQAEAELNSYLQAPDADSETNPLAWWKINSATYPRVSLLAKRYLCIPATSSPSERAFSTGGNVVSGNRAALKPDTGFKARQTSLSGKKPVEV
ncbi:unnamed protein product [Leuciscus chuanchicus]